MRHQAKDGDRFSYLIPLPGLDDGKHDFHAPKLGEPDGMCPLCNNSQHESIDNKLLSVASVTEVAQKMGLPYDIVKRHCALHMWPMRAGVFLAMFGPNYMSGGDALLLKRGALPSSTRTLAKLPDTLAARVQALRRVGLQERIMEVAPSGIGRYAQDGTRAVGPLVPWNDSRQAAETDARALSAINFFDEMMDIRKCAIRIYDEVMESGDLRYYPTAVAAVRERRGIVETLGKMSLIAKQLTDSKDTAKKLSPALQEMVDRMQVFKDDIEGEGL